MIVPALALTDLSIKTKSELNHRAQLPRALRACPST